MNIVKTAIDTNVLYYAYDTSDIIKNKKAIEILVERPYVSHQVLSEFLYCLIKKGLKKNTSIDLAVKLLNEYIRLLSMHSDVYNYTKFLIKRYGFQLWDAIIVADCVLNDCTILLTEDMCNGLSVEKRLKIINPFQI